MTERDNTGPRDNDLSNLVDRAVGDLVPTTTAEVARAEADGCEHEGELPEALLTYREPEPESERVEARIRSNVVPLFSHAFALLAGAAAAVVFARATTAPPVLRAGGDPVVSAKRAPSRRRSGLAAPPGAGLIAAQGAPARARLRR